MSGYVHVNTLWCSDCNRTGRVNGNTCDTCSGSAMIHKCTRCSGNTSTMVNTKYVCCTI